MNDTRKQGDFGSMNEMVAAAAPGDASPYAGMTTVAPASASAKLKDSADFVCDGKDDQVELRASIEAASRFSVRVDKDPATQRAVMCYGRHSVLWLPGDYQLDETLVMPDAADVVISAQGSYFHYGPPEDSDPAGGDAIIVRGMNRCRYAFGTVQSNATGAALRILPMENMPALMSFVSFTGLVGVRQRGIGLHLDHRYENVCVNRFEGTDI